MVVQCWWSACGQQWSLVVVVAWMLMINGQTQDRSRTGSQVRWPKVSGYWCISGVYSSGGSRMLHLMGLCCVPHNCGRCLQKRGPNHLKFQGICSISPQGSNLTWCQPVPDNTLVFRNVSAKMDRVQKWILMPKNLKIYRLV